MKKIMLLCIMIFLIGCQANPMKPSRLSIGEPTYVKIGMGVSYDETNPTKLTYAMIGVNKEGIINYLVINENDLEFGNKKPTTLSKRELGNNYGLSLESDKGDWLDQIMAFENYIEGNKFTIDKFKTIELQENGKPKPEDDYSAGCELDLTYILRAVNNAIENMKEIDGYQVGMSQYTTFSLKKNTTEITLSLVATDYFNKIDYIDFDQYIFTENKRVVSQKANNDWKSQVDFLEKMLTGLRTNDFKNMETYDSGDGVNYSLPLKNTELSENFHINLGEFQKAVAKGI